MRAGIAAVAALAAVTALTACSGGSSPAPSAPTSSSSSPAPPPSPSSPSSSSTSPSAAALPAGTSTRHLTVDGVNRTFLVHRPATLPTGPVPLVLMIHGGGGSAAGAEHSYGWDALADRHGFVAMYPNGLYEGWDVGGGCCARASHDADVAFITAAVHAVESEVSIDPNRVYATGISEGGMMSYRLACDTTLFAAIAPDSATLLGSCASPRPLSVLHIHGTADQRIPYDGSAGAGVNHIDGPPITTLNATWRGIDQCSAPSTSTHGVVTTSTASCPDRRAVELITIAGAGHQWPGAACNTRCADGQADKPSTALDATSTIWMFFAAHPHKG